MAMTQFDLIRAQAEASARNAAAGVTGKLRQETSLVNRASRLAGKTIQSGEAAVRGYSRKETGWRGTAQTVETEAPPVQVAEDGYVRRSAVQTIRETKDYRRRLVMRGVSIVGLIVIVLAAIQLLMNMGVFTN